MSYSDIDYLSGWNDGVKALNQYGLEYAKVILASVFPKRFDDSRVHGLRNAAEIALMYKVVPDYYINL